MKLVTAIMPTRGRHAWAMSALDSFFKQNYTRKQLVILDDWEDPSFASPPVVTSVTYLRIDGRMIIPEKRNFCCSVASGEIICHFDDDDWSDPNRIADQFKRLQESGGSVTAYSSMLFYEPATNKATKFIGDRTCGVGTSLMYTRDHWKRHPFRPGLETPNVGEDNQFVDQAVRGGEFTAVDVGQMMVARVHPGNTSPKDVSRYRPIPFESIPRGFLL